MARKLAPDKVQAILQAIAEGFNDTQISKRLRVNPLTVNRIKLDSTEIVAELKRRIECKIIDTSADKISKLANDMLEGSRKAMELILARLNEASPAQAAVILGILQDKYNLILGNPSANIQVQFQSRADMVGYIRSGLDNRVPVITDTPKIEMDKTENKQG